MALSRHIRRIVKIESSVTDRAILQELGVRLTAARLARNLTQAALAEQAGVSKRTVERLESGQVATHLSGFLRVCRALGLVDRFDALVPSPEPGPVAQLRLQGKTRKRASSKAATSHAPKAWTWDERS